MTALSNFAIRVRNLVVAEVPLLTAAVIVALNATTDRSVKGYIVAAAIAALRFVVSPALKQAALKAKVLDPKVIAQVEAYLAVRDAAKAQAVDAIATS